MAIVIVVLAAKVKEADIFESSDDDIKKTGRNAFYLMIIFACLGLGVGTLGFVTAKWPKW